MRDFYFNEMNKQKHIETYTYTKYKGKKTFRGRKKDYSKELPLRESMRKSHHFDYYNFNGLYFYIDEMIEARIGQKWDKIRSDLLKMIKPKHKWRLKEQLEWYKEGYICDKKNFMFYYNRSYRYNHKIFHVDFDGILRYCTLEETNRRSKKYRRLKRLKEILE